MVEMARRGWRPHGFDLTPEMVTFARERLAHEGLEGTVARGDMADFRTRGRFDLAHCLVSTFKYLLTEDAARGHLRSVARALRPGGIYCLGFHLTDYARTKGSRSAGGRARRRLVDCTRGGGRRARLEPVERDEGWRAASRSARARAGTSAPTTHARSARCCAPCPSWSTSRPTTSTTPSTSPSGSPTNRATRCWCCAACEASKDALQCSSAVAPPPGGSASPRMSAART